MKPVLHNAIVCLALTILMGALVPLRAQQAAATAPSSAKAPEEDKLILSAYQIEMAKNEILRRAELRKHQSDFANLKEYVLQINRPIIEGNYNDYQTNSSQYEKAKDKAQELRLNGDTKRAEAMAVVADYYRQVALANKAIYLAYTQKSGSVDIKEPLQTIKTIEKKFAELTNHVMKRTWLTPDEFNAYRNKLRYAKEKKLEDARRPTGIQGRQ